MKIPELELDSTFYNDFLQLLSKSFENKNMAIIEFVEDGLDIYVLCDVSLDPVTNRIGFTPIAKMFNKDPYKTLTLKPNGIVATQTDINNLFNKVENTKIDTSNLN
jgi:hypothetical protein